MTGPGGGRWARGAPASAFAHLIPVAVLLLYSPRDKSPEFPGDQGNDDMEKEIISDEGRGKGVGGLGMDIRVTS